MVEEYGEKARKSGEKMGEKMGEKAGHMSEKGGQMKATLEKHLRGVSWPVNKNDLITKVRTAGAPNEIIQQIQRLPQDRFQSEMDLTRAFERT